MADNTTLNSMTGGDVISSDVITTLNGSSITTGEKAQRMKTGFGADGTLVDVSASNPLPVTLPTTQVANDTSTINGTPVTTVADGVQLNALADDLGDTLNTTNHALNTYQTNAPSTVTSNAGSAVLTAGSFVEKAGLSAGALNADFLPITDVSATPYVKVTFGSNAFVGTLTFQGSNDANFINSFTVALNRSDSTTVAPATTNTAVSTSWNGYIPFRFFRIRMTAFTSGSAQGVVELSSVGAPANSSTIVQGTGADAAALAGNPVRIAGSDGTNARTPIMAASNADALAANATANQFRVVAETFISNGTTSDRVRTANADGQAVTGILAAGDMLFNGATWDRVRNNLVTTTGDTGAKTATFNGATQTNFNARGVTVVLNIGTVTGTTPTLVAKIQGSADSGTTWYDIPGATTAPLVASGVWGISVYPGAAVTAGTTTSGTTAVASQALPRTWRVVYTIGGTTPSFTLTNVQVAYTI